MTKEDKLLVHLEHVIFEDLPPGTSLNAKQIIALIGVATEDQKKRAYERALIKIPILLEDER